MVNISNLSYQRITIDGVLQKGKPIHNVEILINDKVYIFNFIPIIENEKIMGVVSSFRDKTELKSLLIRSQRFVNILRDSVRKRMSTLINFTYCQD